VAVELKPEEVAELPRWQQLTRAEVKRICRGQYVKVVKRATRSAYRAAGMRGAHSFYARHGTPYSGLARVQAIVG
jgi:hypothetical protein